MSLDLSRRNVGRTNLKISVLGLGCAPFGGLFRSVATEAARTAIDAAYEAGIRYFDTAPYYGFGRSERVVGDGLRGRPDVVLSTKVGRILLPGAAPDPGAYGYPDSLPFHPVFDYGYDAVMRSWEHSLQRLGLDHVDILYLHDLGEMQHGREANERHFADAMDGGYRALDELRRSGAIEAIGLGVNEWQVCRRALDHGSWDVFLLAGRYTLLEQEPLERLFPACEAAGTSIVVGGPYNSGVLVGGDTYNYAGIPADVAERVRRLRAVADRHGVPLGAAALQFPLAHPVVASVIAGVRGVGELADMTRWFSHVIPAAFWADLRAEKLLPDEAPTPG